MASGGGYWLLYRYDAENTLEETRLRERALRTLKATFPAVDTSVSNASRIVRFAHTRNLKQHRMSYLVTPHGVELEPLQRELLGGAVAPFEPGMQPIPSIVLAVPSEHFIPTPTAGDRHAIGRRPPVFPWVRLP
jgi:hypothetical protein